MKNFIIQRTVFYHLKEQKPHEVYYLEEPTFTNCSDSEKWCTEIEKAFIFDVDTLRNKLGDPTKKTMNNRYFEGFGIDRDGTNPDKSFIQKFVEVEGWEQKQSLHMQKLEKLLK